MNTTSTTAQRYLTIAQFCERFGITRGFYFKLRTRGEGPIETRIGRSVRIADEHVEAWEAQRRTSPSAAAHAA
jgi:predicted DNA-binding transcriptional regulator AlpA